MHFLLGLLFGYYIRGKKPLLVATLTIIASFVLSCCPQLLFQGSPYQLDLNDSHDLHKHVPPLVGLDYKTAETALHNSKLNIRVPRLGTLIARLERQELESIINAPTTQKNREIMKIAVRSAQH